MATGCRPPNSLSFWEGMTSVLSLVCREFHKPERPHQRPADRPVSRLGRAEKLRHDSANLHPIRQLAPVERKLRSHVRELERPGLPGLRRLRGEGRVHRQQLVSELAVHLHITWLTRAVVPDCRFSRWLESALADAEVVPEPADGGVHRAGHRDGGQRSARRRHLRSGVECRMREIQRPACRGSLLGLRR